MMGVYCILSVQIGQFYHRPDKRVRTGTAACSVQLRRVWSIFGRRGAGYREPTMQCQPTAGQIRHCTVSHD